MNGRALKRTDRWNLEGAARSAYRMLKGSEYRMMRCSYDKAPEAFCLIFAFGDRADELEEAFREVRARHALARPEGASRAGTQ